MLVAITEPLGPDDWDALLDAIIERAEGCSGTSVVLPARLPGQVKMAEELQRSLVRHLRGRGLAVIESG